VEPRVDQAVVVDTAITDVILVVAVDIAHVRLTEVVAEADDMMIVAAVHHLATISVVTTEIALLVITIAMVVVTEGTTRTIIVVIIHRAIEAIITVVRQDASSLLVMEHRVIIRLVIVPRAITPLGMAELNANILLVMADNAITIVNHAVSMFHASAPPITASQIVNLIHVRRNVSPTIGATTIPVNLILVGNSTTTGVVAQQTRCQ
jgi:hypothetical protein